jgi:hypothetical protein
MAEKSFKFEYTVAGARTAPQYKIVRAMNLATAQRTFATQTADKVEPEITDVWQHVAKGSTRVVRKNTITRV